MARKSNRDNKDNQFKNSILDRRVEKGAHTSWLSASEEQNLLQIRLFFARYGLKIFAVLGGIVLIIGIWFGFSFAQRTISADNSTVYFSVINDNTQNFEEHEEKLLQLIDNEDGFSTLAALTYARLTFERGAFDKSEETLRRALDFNTDSLFDDLIKLRLATVLYSKDSLVPQTEALELLDEIQGDIKPLAEELKGDIFFLAGESERARSAYTLALEEFSSRGINTLRIETKLLNIE